MTGTKLRGKVWKFGDNVNTDEIIPSRYCNTFDPEVLKAHVMEGVDPDFAKRVAPGDIIVAGHNFGTGSSREAAVVAIKAAGIGAVIASSFARLFFRNAINVGLPVLISPSASEDLKSGEEIDIDFVTHTIHSRDTGKTYRAREYNGTIQEIIEAGGMLEYVKERVEANQRKAREHSNEPKNRSGSRKGIENISSGS